MGGKLDPSKGGKAVAGKFPPAYCPHCHKLIDWTATWHSYLGHLGLHGLANRYFDGDIHACQKRLRDNGLARQDPAPWNGSWLKYKPIKPLVLCVCCDKPATHLLGDWEVCEEHYNSLAGPAAGLDDETLF